MGEAFTKTERQADGVVPDQQAASEPRATRGADGTTGRSLVSGRRTHIIQILRDHEGSLSAAEISQMVGIHLNTARFHLENLVDAGLAKRALEKPTGPGRPRTLYTGTLPNQTHERAQGYRVLAEAMTTVMADNVENAAQLTRDVGRGWGHAVIHADDISASVNSETGEVNQNRARERVVAKMDALWFAPEVSSENPHQLVMHNCPFLELAERRPDITCALHAGLVDGALEALGSTLRVCEILPLDQPHTCHMMLTATVDGVEPELHLAK